MAADRIQIRNKRATFDYEIEDKLVAGMQLTGTEIKSLRQGRASLVDSFCFYLRNELWLKGLNISEYFYGTYNNHQPQRDRKLLLKKKELAKWERKIKDTGYTIVPLRVFINQKGWAKIEIGLARGKKTYDKRQSLKEKDAKRDIDKAMKRDY
ncbi:MAG: SsrA-binding protein SmpB [Breznakibacter sp.]|nr:SsrA-binding protein SmpB [Breznakibacter sp.]